MLTVITTKNPKRTSERANLKLIVNNTSTPMPMYFVNLFFFLWLSPLMYQKYVFGLK